ncbi:MAG: carbohydrate kinase [Erythrobacter sp.]|nr:carbohydrate kinase [Erythrobacter sp.]
MTETAAGGCAVNLGDGLLGYGLQLDYFGTVGKPLHKAFEPFAAQCRSCTGWGTDPGKTLAFEFQDGKYMLSSVSQLADFTPESLRESLADGAFAAACSRAGALAFTNWTLYPHMTECWQVIQQEVISKLPNNPWIFLDLVDPRSRSEADIKAMLDVVPAFEDGGRLVFGGNLNEANVLAGILGVPKVDEETGPAVADQAAAIREKLGVSQVATHCIACAAVADANDSWHAVGPYTPTPKRSTGAGDRYNAGYVMGLLLDLPPEQRLLLGNATSGYFVRNAESGNADHIADLLDAWADGSLSD